MRHGVIRALAGSAVGAILASVALADVPVIEFDPQNELVPNLTSGPLPRDWTWTCTDSTTPPDDPLSLRCQVYDITNGAVGGGNEVLLADSDCGTGPSPVVAVHTYDVPSPGSDRKYVYAAYCRDSGGWTRNQAGSTFWYDLSAPTVSIASGPPSETTDAEVQLAFSCEDGSFDYDYSPAAYDPPCLLTCALYDASTNAVLVPPGPCDVSSVLSADTQAVHTFSNLSPGAYRAEIVGTDAVGNDSLVATWEWTVTTGTPVPIMGLWFRLVLLAGGAALGLRAASEQTPQ